MGLTCVLWYEVESKQAILTRRAFHSAPVIRFAPTGMFTGIHYREEERSGSLG